MSGGGVHNFKLHSALAVDNKQTALRSPIFCEFVLLQFISVVRRSHFIISPTWQSTIAWMLAMAYHPMWIDGLDGWVDPVFPLPFFISNSIYKLNGDRPIVWLSESDPISGRIWDLIRFNGFLFSTWFNVQFVWSRQLMELIFEVNWMNSRQLDD